MFQDPRSSKSGEWAIPQQSKLRYTQIFNQHDRNRTGFLTGLQCRNILLQSNLPQNILAQIWDLSDIDSDGQLTREEFLLAMHLTDFIKSGNKLPAELPPDLIPPSYRRTRSISVASVVSSGSVSSSAANNLDDATAVAGGGMDGTESVGSASSAKSVLSNNTFEDKRRENFEKGQAELERRRLQLLEQQRHEQEARQKKDREEAEKREKLRTEQEKKRFEELNRLQEKNRLLEAEKEEQKRQQLDKREQARRELEKQRMAELESLRQQELLVQSQTAQEAMVHLRNQKQILNSDMEKLNEQYDKIRGSLNTTRMLVSDKKSKIDSMRSDRDTKMGMITSLRAQIKSLVDKMAYLEKEETNLVAIARDLNLVPNSAQNEVDLQAIQAKQASIEQMKDKINELIKEKETKAKELESNKIILKDTIDKLQTQTDAATEAYKVYQETLEKAKVLREEYVKQSKIQAQDPDAIWNTKSTEDSWGNSSEQTIKQAQLSKPAANKTGVTYRALYAFEARNIDELTINPGDIIAAVDTLTEPGWLSGELNGKSGWFPEAYVEKLEDSKSIQDPFGQPIASKEIQLTSSDTFGFDSFSQISDNLSFSNNKQVKGTTQASTDPNKRQDSNATSNSDPSPSSAATTVVEAGLVSDLKQSVPLTSMDDMREVFDKINLNDEFCLTLYPFESTETGDLAFTSDEYIKILKKEGDWWTGEVIGNPARVGMFPSNYVKPIEASEVLQHQQQPLNKTSTTNNKSETSLETDLPKTSDNQSASITTPKVAPTSQKSVEGGGKSRNKKPEVATVVANYRALGPEQLSLEKGQLVLIRRKMDSGWWEGEIQVKGKKKQFGWFPASYVKPLSSQAEQANQSLSTTTINDSQEMMKGLEKVVACFPFSAQHDDELSFEPGDVILVLSKNEDPTWWKGKLLSTGATGLFPSNHIEPYVEKKADSTKWTSFDGSEESVDLFNESTKLSTDTMDADWGTPTWPPINMIGTEQRQSSVKSLKQNLLIVNELINTERDYVADLEFVNQNYIIPLSKLLSTKEQQVIFINWEQITKMHKSLLKNLTRRKPNQINSEMEAIDMVIRCMIEFLKQAPKPYMIFCCNQIEACRILQVKLDSDMRFKQLMRDCDRHNDNKSRLPYTTYLLKPMQRITRYSLFLEKMLTDIKTDHCDHERLLAVNEASELAQKLCQQVNEACKTQQDSQENRKHLEWCQAHIKLTSSCSGSSPLIGIPSPTLLTNNGDKYLDEPIIFDSLTNCSGRRKLIKAGTLIKSRSGKELMAFLFNDFLLLTVPTVFIPKVSNLFDNKRALQAYYKIYRRPLLLDRLAIVSDISDDVFRSASVIDFINPYEPEPNTTDMQQNSKDTSFRLDNGADGKVYSLKCLDVNEKKSWLKELKLASEGMIENKLKLRSLEPIIRKPDPSQCSGRLFVTLIEAKNLRHPYRSTLHLYATISLICFERDLDYPTESQGLRDIVDGHYIKLNANTSSSTSNIINNTTTSESSSSIEGSSLSSIVTSINEHRYERMGSLDDRSSSCGKSPYHHGSNASIRQIIDKYRTRTIKTRAVNSLLSMQSATSSSNQAPILPSRAHEQKSRYSIPTLMTISNMSQQGATSLTMNNTGPLQSRYQRDCCTANNTTSYAFNVTWNDSTQFLLEDVSLSSKDALILTINEENPFTPITQIADCVLPIGMILSNIGSAVGPIEKDFPLNSKEHTLVQSDLKDDTFPSVSNLMTASSQLRKGSLQLSKSLNSFTDNTRIRERDKSKKDASMNKYVVDNSWIRLKFDVQIFNSV